MKQLEPDSSAPLQILDVGTGSGAIAIALAHHLPNAHITATDISPAALEVAASNAERHHLTNRIHFLESDLLSAFEANPAPISSRSDERDGQSPAFAREARPEQHEVLTREALRERYEVLVSNPPYVPTNDRHVLHPQVRDFEPAAALFAGPTGLDIYRRLIPQARAALNPNGLLALEIGHGQREAIAEMLAAWNSVRFIDDLQHIPRVVLARKPNSEMTRHPERSA
jgi:release factor glutamine methyltransferase